MVKLFNTTFETRRFKNFIKSPFVFFRQKIIDLTYQAKCYFSPYNVVTCKDLESGWADRDRLMFHAMFQILVDFVELEQPFRNWEDKYSKFANKRHTDRIEMYLFNERWYNSEDGKKSSYHMGATQEQKKQYDLETFKRYNINREILFLYGWYKDKKYEFDDKTYRTATGVRYVFDSNTIKTVETGNPILITTKEFADIQEEHDELCSLMLERILSIRQYLWT